ncbi:MAG: indolepyruvate ferredoxin oxidoreductase family protein, partial [Pseudomonadota bacterium]
MDGSELIPTAETDEAHDGGLRPVALSDRYDVSKRTVLVSGVQAMIRLPLMQKARDLAAGSSTTGYVTGYRGSPLGGVDLAAWKAKKTLEAADIRFEPALNEDLAATMIWGAQQAHLRGQGTHEGVFSLWYGKGPGLDRSGDVFRHGNLAGVGPKGGVLVAMGDDHTCESSTSCHQTDVTLMDAHIPVLHPAGPQEILDYGLIGWGLSRFTGCWVGVKCLKDTVEATTVVDGSLDRVSLVLPDIPTPPEGMNIILGETPHQQEARLQDWRLPAIAPFARANGLDQRRIGRAGARIGIVSSGKSWLDVVAALDLLGIDAVEAERLGLSVYKIGLAWPLDAEGLRDFADGLERMIVVEEKRAFIETQAKEALYALPDRPEIVGKRTRDGAPLFSPKMDLNPLEIAEAIADAILEKSPDQTHIAAARDRVRAQRREQ